MAELLDGPGSPDELLGGPGSIDELLGGPGSVDELLGGPDSADDFGVACEVRITVPKLLDDPGCPGAMGREDAG